LLDNIATLRCLKLVEDVVVDMERPLQHFFSVRVITVAGFLRPSSPWFYVAVVHAAGIFKIGGETCFDLRDRAILTSDSEI
jgi:hypothetical protein